MMKRIVIRAALTALLALGLVALTLPDGQANVSLKNGNYFVGFTDIVYPGGFEPKIQRVYNSKTPYKGMFGWGWGTEYEAFLRVAADGSVTVHEYGGGSENRFYPSQFKAEELKGAVVRIADAAKKVGRITNTTNQKDYETRLMKDAEFRSKEWTDLIAAGALKPRELAVGTQLSSNKFSHQMLYKTKEGYKRTFDTGKVEFFSDAGKLLEIRDKNGNWMKFSYKGEVLKMIEDNLHRKMFLTFNNAGLLEKVEGENGKVASYQYNKLGQLVWSKDVEGGVYKYEYDDRHFITQIVYPDGGKEQIAYYKSDLFENVKSIKDRDGTFTEYFYKGMSPTSDHYTVSLKVKGKEKTISESSYEYFVRTKKTGEQWTYRLITVVDGDRTETTYNECCGLPVSIKRGGEETQFKYDPKGHVVEKTTPAETTRLAYHPTCSKVSKVEKFSKGQKQQNWSKFDYDGRCNLSVAVNSDNKKVKLLYDNNGRIKTMIDQGGRKIGFDYDENSKPIKITDAKLGTIDVEYKNSGEIKNVKSSGGRKIALQVTSAFQNLLEIIRPAGVTLSF